MYILMLLVKGFQLYIFPSCFVQKNVSFPVSRSAPLRSVWQCWLSTHFNIGIRSLSQQQMEYWICN